MVRKKSRTLKTVPPIKADDFRLIKGIGPVLAARIVAARGVHGFSSWDEVLAVKGIGPRLIARWQALSARQ